ncbi:DUF3486 family protein [Rhodobacter sp. NTK016B]|uniref:DUF3486 family protein n=1 Tax=Rhodobacter sp. NTK016B TaxID=2759676 RepID=UPI001A90371F|nr:DUF3486 family protein [Rhodobacter sp. NTK016B]MBN8290572.1 DUF3486 family protein [Rhodobacter sp. NTK016B]
MTQSPRGRGRLSSFDLMPPEADGIIAWAAQELSDRERTQTDIYAEFVTRCEALMREHRGELEFSIPAFSSFNRYSMRLARLTRRLDQTKAIVSTLAEKFDPADADNLTVMTAETVKALVLTMLSETDEDGIDAKSVMQLAAAFKQAVQAQSISTDRRRKAEADFQTRVEDAVQTVAKAKGLTAETTEAIKSQILGVGA